jgi:hypothetical protein
MLSHLLPLDAVVVSIALGDPAFLVLRLARGAPTLKPVTDRFNICNGLF